ncbi:DUF1993 domain-containing protein [Sinorhizobium numidicum]|uniref:DUF1993 domain-containing protein n=1 Tax=Sinorhizobium numidicum TaxID=680248 RepID=A0ABY8CZA8_9HYPH|nr:DUF1993 domain-containing protein [Sinorhizobium numidicum]WEX76556.1 DUF1993 domain-containing protein [Sinorhizobium numidicum]WEX83217.1 DUF1993 domain-containing protein [Sinorhizobium numidicum]
MPLTMYRLSIPAFTRGFSALGGILDKAEAFASDTGIPLAELFEARLAPDMLPLAGQVQRASDTSKNAIARLTTLEAPRFPDDEQSFADLRGRIAKTVAFFESVKPADLEGSESREVTLNFTKLKVSFSGEDYLLKFVLPNFYFHVTTAYDILRHKGVPIGKPDYIGSLD